MRWLSRIWYCDQNYGWYGIPKKWNWSQHLHEIITGTGCTSLRFIITYLSMLGDEKFVPCFIARMKRVYKVHFS